MDTAPEDPSLRGAAPPSGPPPAPAWPRTRWGAPAVAVAAFAAWFVIGQCLPGLVVGLAESFRSAGKVDAARMSRALVDAVPWIQTFGVLTAVAIVASLVQLRWLADRPVPPGGPRFLRSVLWTLAAAFACVFGQHALTTLLSSAGHEVEEQEIVVQAVRTGGTAIWLALIVAAPLAEELIFRRIVFVQVRAANGRALAYLLSTALFALAHLHPSAFVNYLWVGLCCAYALERTGSVGAAVLVHAVNNGAGLVAQP